MDPPKEHHQGMRRLGHVFSEMKQDPTATPQVMPKTTQEFEECGISKSILQPRTADAPVKMPDDDDEQG
jgi:hypothetical protein